MIRRTFLSLLAGALATPWLPKAPAAVLPPPPVAPLAPALPLLHMVESPLMRVGDLVFLDPAGQFVTFHGEEGAAIGRLLGVWDGNEVVVSGSFVVDDPGTM